MIISLGSKDRCQSTSFLDCFACHEKLTVHVNWYEGYEHEDVNKLAHDIGWVRREFHPQIDPWFCSKHCAFDSIKAKTLIEYWIQYRDGKNPRYDAIEEMIRKNER